MKDGQPQRLLVIIAEDDTLCADALEEMLSLLGYEVAVTRNAADTLAVIERLPELPFALITDQHMGEGLTGQEACQYAQEKFPGLPCMVLSGDTSPGFKSLMRTGGIVTAHKPASPTAIMDFIQHAQSVWDGRR
ncbi:MAG TPA: response regulator [Azospirillum sp.]